MLDPLTFIEIKKLKENIIPGKCGVYSKEWKPTLQLSYWPNGMIKISDGAGFLTATNDITTVVKLLKLESENFGAVRKLITGEIPHSWELYRQADGKFDFSIEPEITDVMSLLDSVL